MFSTAPAGQVYESGMQVIKGRSPWGDIPLTVEAKFAAATLAATAFPGGRVGSRNAAGEIVLSNAGNDSVPIHLFYGNYDPAVRNDGVSPVSGKKRWASVTTRNIAAGMVGMPGLEIQTTEFVPASTTGVPYAPDQWLTTDADGKVQNNATFGTDWIVGITSFGTPARTIDPLPTSPVTQNAYGTPLITFYTFFHPAS